MFLKKSFCEFEYFLRSKCDKSTFDDHGAALSIDEVINKAHLAFLRSVIRQTLSMLRIFSHLALQLSCGFSCAQIRSTNHGDKTHGALFFSS